MMNDKKLKVYLDTSVISYLKQEDAIDKMRITNDLWEKFKSNVFDVCLSDLTLLEIGRCDEPKASYLRNRISEIPFKRFTINSIVTNLAKEIINVGILTEKSIEDC